MLLGGANGGHGEQLVDRWCCEVTSHLYRRLDPLTIGEILQLRQWDDKDYDNPDTI